MITIYKVIADKRPTECFTCPIKRSGIKTNMGECGKKIKTNLPSGWIEGKRIPDERCVFEVKI